MTTEIAQMIGRLMIHLKMNITKDNNFLIPWRS
jgi:hypothetical protein